MQAAVLLFPGSNAEAEMIHTLRDVVGISTTVVWHGDPELPAGTDLVAIPGGFSYGDYLRCGAIARTSPVVAALRRHVEREGMVLGVCNGFQILTEAGLLPGALTRNAHLRFECRDIYVRADAVGPFTPEQGRVLRLPIAHAEGSYYADEQTLGDLERDDLVALRYCDATGQSTPQANPNGSLHDIAGIYGGPARNVLGLMPHPERMSEPLHGGEDGRRLFEAVVRFAAEHPSGRSR
ncbi:MAG: phosphoribosylformylglycinamidine synthase subunit PurQ [Deltaproteobacteria bacterium]|jgi:phosphoribosylformylglycinamidine synthase|nr:phosphoribosylformylglycinamidine synthase subunit PurQ [Deltaproteobacteria bacterium]MBW2535202.1 phosphoribosylformylglycinamidine synthase subunit PurQ [Deltaproteobacteria bacterium]